jgi:hypothetical protein
MTDFIKDFSALLDKIQRATPPVRKAFAYSTVTPQEIGLQKATTNNCSMCGYCTDKGGMTAKLYCLLQGSDTSSMLVCSQFEVPYGNDSPVVDVGREKSRTRKKTTLSTNPITNQHANPTGGGSPLFTGFAPRIPGNH